MSPIDHLDLVVTALGRSLAFYDPDGIKLELLHRPQERDLVREVRRLRARVEELERRTA